MSEGFGWSFYGFFVVAAAWCVVYFVWAVRKNAQEAGVTPQPSEREGDSMPSAAASEAGGDASSGESSVEVDGGEEG